MYHGSIDMAAEIIDGAVLVLLSFALHGAFACAAALLWWRRRRRQGAAVKPQRFWQAGAGLGIGLVFAAGLSLALWRWSVLESDFYVVGLILLELEAFFAFAASALCVRYWRQRSKSEFPLKKRWLVLGSIVLGLSALALLLFRAVHTLWGFVPFRSWQYFKPTTLLSCAAALLLLAGGILLRVKRKHSKRLLAAGLVILTLLWPITEAFADAILPWGEYEFFEPASDGTNAIYGKNSTHFYWLTGGYYEDYVLNRVPLSQPDSRPERIPLPIVSHDDYTSYHLAGVTDKELYLAIEYADPAQPEYEEDWERQEYNEAPLRIVVEGDEFQGYEDECDTYILDENDESTPAWWRTAVYRIPLDTLLGEKIYEGWYNGAAWYHAETDSLLLIREIGGWVFAAQMNPLNGEKTLLWKGEWFFGSGNAYPFIWTPVADGQLMLSKDPIAQEGNRVLFSAELKKTQRSSWYLLRQAPPDSLFARQQLQRTPHLKDYAVWNGDVYFVAAEDKSRRKEVWNGSYYTNPPASLYRLNSNGKGKTLLWYDCAIDTLQVVNGALYCRVNRILPDFSFGQKGEAWLTQWLRLSNDGQVTALVSKNNAALLPLGEDVLVWRSAAVDSWEDSYDGYDDENQPLFSLYCAAAHDRVLAAMEPWQDYPEENGVVPIGGEKEPPEGPQRTPAQTSWGEDWAITQQWLYWLNYVCDCYDYEEADAYDYEYDHDYDYVELCRAPLKNLSAVERVPLDRGYSHAFLGADQKEVLLSADSWTYMKPSLLLRVGHDSTKTKSLLELDPEQRYCFNQASGTLLAARIEDDRAIVEGIDLGTQKRTLLFESSDYAAEADGLLLRLYWNDDPQGTAALHIEPYHSEYWNAEYQSITVLFDEDNRPALAAQLESPAEPQDEPEEESAAFWQYSHLTIDGTTYYLADYDFFAGLYRTDEDSPKYWDEPLYSFEETSDSLWLRRFGRYVAVVGGNGDHIALYDTAAETLYE